MFTCYDHYRKWGDYDYNAGLIEFWEKPNQLKRTWNFCIFSAVRCNCLTYEDLEPFRRKYTDSKLYKKIIKGRDTSSEIRMIKAQELAKKAQNNRIKKMGGLTSEDITQNLKSISDQEQIIVNIPIRQKTVIEEPKSKSNS